jgi:hypothetical protein
MHGILPLSLAVLVSLGIIVIGTLYLFSPKRILGEFGLKPPAADPDTHAWLRLKGVRDITSGVAVLTLWLTTNSHTVGILLLVFALIPFGDMSTILGTGGSRSKAFSVHGVTCAVMLLTGLLLIHVL